MFTKTVLPPAPCSWPSTTSCHWWAPPGSPPWPHSPPSCCCSPWDTAITTTLSPAPTLWRWPGLCLPPSSSRGPSRPPAPQLCERQSHPQGWNWNFELSLCLWLGLPVTCSTCTWQHCKHFHHCHSHSLCRTCSRRNNKLGFTTKVNALVVESLYYKLFLEAHFTHHLFSRPLSPPLDAPPAWEEGLSGSSAVRNLEVSLLVCWQAAAGAVYDSSVFLASLLGLESQRRLCNQGTSLHNSSTLLQSLNRRKSAISPSLKIGL